MTIKPLTISKLNTALGSSANICYVNDATRFSENTLPIYATITPFGETANIDNSEIIQITASDSSTGMLTITRAQKDTTAKEFAIGSLVYRGVYDDDLVDNTSEVLKQAILNIAYPIGTVYTSVNNVSPAIFIGGTWQAIDGGYYMKTITSGSGGATGGSSASGSWSGNTGSHILTGNEIPSHNHGESQLVGRYSSGDSSFIWNTWADGICSMSGSRQTFMQDRVNNNGPNKNIMTINATHTHNSYGGDGGHTHSIPSHNHTIDPLYVNVYAWKRTA